MKNTDNYPRSRVKKEELYPGRAVLYKPDLDSTHFDPSTDIDDLPYGSMGIFVSMGMNWEKFVNGHEPIDVLFGALGRIIRIYMDEIEIIHG